MKAQTTITIDWLKLAEGIGWFITMLASVPYSSGEIALWFPPLWRPYISTIFLLATVGVKVWRAVPALPGNIWTPKPAAAPPCPVCEKRKRAKGSKK